MTTFSIDPVTFAADPYPVLEQMRAKAPVAHVPELRATLFTRRDDIYKQEKRIDLFSSYQPKGLLQQIMGDNMMRKDGEAHQVERKAIFPALSPRTVRDRLASAYDEIVAAHIARIRPLGAAEIVRDFALPVAADALRVTTGLTNMDTYAMDAASQAMLDGAANYVGDKEIEARAYAASASVDGLIDEQIAALRKKPDQSIISVLDQAGLSRDAIAGTIKVIIGGGQNEPRDAIAGTIWALLTHPGQHDLIKSGHATYEDAFGEYIRLVTPIAMTPRRVTRDEVVCGVQLKAEQTVFLMFSSACRDEAHFKSPNVFDLMRDNSAALPFGAGPHFCAGAAASRCLIAQTALPRLFAALHDLEITGDVPFHGWAFRGPVRLPLRWRV